MAKDIAIYISSHSIQYVEGSCEESDVIRLDNFKEVPLPEGAMINGIITDEALVSQALHELKEDRITSARLVIDSGAILTKNITVPFLNKKELMVIVKDEFSDIDETYEDLIYDYSVLRESYDEEETKGGEILCCAMERKLLASYLELFQHEKIQLKSVDVSLNALHKLTQELPDFHNKNYILTVLDNNNLSSYLFEHNKYTFSNRTRLFSERGSNEFITEMNSNVSQLIQFNKSRKSPYAIDTVYLCGIQGEEEQVIFESLKKNLNIDALPFPNAHSIYIADKAKAASFQLHNYVISLGCLIRK